MRLTQKMNKILIIALIVIAVSGVALLLSEYSAGKSYPRDTVTSAVNFGAAALGGVLEEHRTVSGSLRNVGLFARIGTWMRKLTGQATPADADEFLVIDVGGNSPRLALVDEKVGQTRLPGCGDDFRLTVVEFRHEQGIRWILALVDPGLLQHSNQLGVVGCRFSQQFVANYRWNDHFRVELERQHLQADLGQTDQRSGVAHDFWAWLDAHENSSASSSSLRSATATPWRPAANRNSTRVMPHDSRNPPRHPLDELPLADDFRLVGEAQRQAALMAEVMMEGFREILAGHGGGVAGQVQVRAVFPDRVRRVAGGPEHVAEARLHHSAGRDA